MVKHFDDEGYMMAGGTPGEDMFNENENRPNNDDNDNAEG